MLTFSFIIPVKPHGVVKAKEALRQLKAPSSQFEILVVEGTKPSRQRNLAAQNANGDILYFLDDDSLVTTDCMILCEMALKNPGVAVVGGPSLTPDTDSTLQHVFGTAISSPFGAGSMCNRYRAVGGSRETSEQELILCNLAFRKDVFLSEAGFDERLYPNEENELLDRISAAGYKMIHIPSMSVMRSQRCSLSAFIKQMFSYGRGRAQQTWIAGPRSLMSFMPLLFVIYLAALPLLPLNLIWQLPLIIYVFFDIFFATRVISTSGTYSAMSLLLFFPLMHCANGIGLLYGLFSGRPRMATAEDITILRVKEFNQTSW